MTDQGLVVMTAPARWDSRVTKPAARGARRPVPSYGLPCAGRWLRICRAPGPDGVVLQVRIPGYEPEDRDYPDQAAAEAAGQDIYAGYCTAVEALAKAGDDNE
jgi:hypothetical protein